MYDLTLAHLVTSNPDDVITVEQVTATGRSLYDGDGIQCASYLEADALLRTLQDAYPRHHYLIRITPVPPDCPVCEQPVWLQRWAAHDAHMANY